MNKNKIYKNKNKIYKIIIRNFKKSAHNILFQKTGLKGFI